MTRKAPGRTLNTLEVAVVERNAPVPATRIKFPMEAAASASGATTSGSSPSGQLAPFKRLAEDLEEGADTLRPWWWDKAWLRRIYRLPWPDLGISGSVALLVPAKIEDLKRRRWLYERRQRLWMVRMLRILQWPTLSICLLMMTGGLAWCFAQGLVFGLIVVVVAIGVLLSQ